MSAFISVLGLLNYDDTLLDSCFLDAFINIFGEAKASDMLDTFVDLALYECADLETTLPNPVFFRRFVKKWANNQVDKWSAYYKTQTLIRDNLDSYMDGRRIEEYIGNKKETNENNGTNTSTETTETNSNYNEDNNVYGFNESSAKPKDNSVQTSDIQGNASTETKAKFTNNNNRDDSYTKTVKDNSLFVDNVQKLDRLAGLNTINFIIAEFRSKFCLEVY